MLCIGIFGGASLKTVKNGSGIRVDPPTPLFFQNSHIFLFFLLGTSLTINKMSPNILEYIFVNPSFINSNKTANDTEQY